MEEYQPESKTEISFYACSENQCFLPIEIISLDKETIKFKCFNKKDPHIVEMKIEDYINKMKMHNINEKRGKCTMKDHHKYDYESFCFECSKHLCEICLKSREHLSHNKIDIKEYSPTKKELEIVNKIIKSIQDNNEFQNLKDLYKIIYNAYKEFSNNYHYCINMNYILFNFIENNKSFKDQLSKEDYELLIKIEKKKDKNYEELINQLLDENKKMESNYERKVNSLKETINNFSNEISKLKEDNNKLLEEINEIKKQKVFEEKQKKLKNTKNNEKENDDNKINKNYSSYHKNNISKEELDVKLNKNNNKNVLVNTDIKNEINVNMNDEKINMVKNDNKGEINFNFQKYQLHDYEIPI